MILLLINLLRAGRPETCGRHVSGCAEVSEYRRAFPVMALHSCKILALILRTWEQTEDGGNVLRDTLGALGCARSRVLRCVHYWSQPPKTDATVAPDYTKIHIIIGYDNELTGIIC